MSSDNSKGGTFRVCRRCLPPEDDRVSVLEYARKLYESLDTSDRASEEMQAKRHDICAACDRNAAGTCLSCGCYTVIRALSVRQNCPRKKW